MKIATADVLISRQAILDRLRPVKAKLINEIEAGNRDWAQLSNLLQEYQDLQTGADALGHTCSIEDRA